MVASMNHIDHPSDVTIPLQDVILENGQRDQTSEERTPSHNEDSENNKQNVGRCGLKLNKKAKIIITTLTILLVISAGYNIFYYVTGKINHLETMSTSKPSLTTSCLQGWTLNEELCYLYSFTENTWHASLRNCSSYGASLFVMTTPQEMAFINEKKAPAEYWIGLKRKNIGENWTLSDGADFNVWFEIKGEGLCATLNDGVVSSTYCDSHRRWICRKILRAV